jgi:protein phosphatase
MGCRISVPEAPDARLFQWLPGLILRLRPHHQLLQTLIREAQEANLQRLRSRGLGAKHSLALREFTLGIEALERFVKGESLWRVHECVFGVLALESEPVDPRL